MNLLSAFNIASSSLSAVSTQTAITSRNIAGASQAGYTRKHANLTTAIGGDVFVSSIGRAADSSLQAQALDANSALNSSNGLLAGYTTLEQVIGSQDSTSYLPSLLTNLQGSLQTYAANPTSTTLGNSVLDSANSLVRGLNSASTSLQATRTTADANIATSVANINDLLQQYSSVDASIVRMTGTNADMTDMLDQRDKLVQSLSQEIGVRAVDKPNGSVGLYTTSGIVLFDGTPRNVTFSQSTVMAPGVTGAAVYIDGVDATSANSPMPIAGGRVSAAIALRDSIVPKLQAQVDEVARGLISTFSESDQTATPTAPTAPGLFTWSGGPAMPGSPATAGLAADIRVNPNADPAQGGQISRIRDGGLADPLNPNYVYNTTSAAGFSDRLRALSNGMDASQTFNNTLGLVAQGSLKDFSTSLVATFEADRSSVSSQASTQQVTSDRTQQALTNATGVNLDEEMAKMLDLEHTYQATAKLITAVDGMLQNLMQVVN